MTVNVDSFKANAYGIYNMHGNVSDLSKLVPKAFVGNGFEFEYSGGSKLSVNLSKWLKKNKVIK